jgi:membrane-associated phospholipid phosphatase
MIVHTTIGMLRIPKAAWFGVVAASVAAGPLSAQTKEVPQTVPDSATVRKHKKLFTHRDLVTAGIWAGTTILLTPLDKSIAHELQDSSVQTNRFLKTASKRVEYIASPGAYFIGGSLYVVGRLARQPRIADLGWHGTEAVMMGELTSYLIKGTVGRARPFVAIDDPDDFKFGRGFGSANWRSFPSGHSTTAFAAAAAVTDETTLWWPKSTWIIGPVMYGGATMVALSRMYHNRHWTSDVAVGALIGTFSGKKVVLASHSSPGNIIDRVMLAGYIAPSEYGALNIGWQKKF